MPSTSRKKLILAAVATAVMWWLAMTPWGLFAFGWIALVPFLFVAGELVTARSRFFYGWATGFLCFALHNWWLIPTITKAGGVIGASPVIGALLGVLSVTLIAAGHGLGLAFLAWLWNPQAPMFRNMPLLLPVCSALFWWAFEWLRGSGVLGHTWGAFTFSQWSDIPLLQTASFLGQYGLGALCVWFAASLALWLYPQHTAKLPGLWRIPVLVFAVLHLWGQWRVLRYEQLPHSPVQVALVATNVSSLSKKRDGSESHYTAAARLTGEYIAGQTASQGLARIVVWPETTLTLETGFAADRYQLGIEQLSRELRGPIIAGAQTFNADGTTMNEAILVQHGRLQQRSGKLHVVPFGEKAPFSEALPFLSLLAPRPPITPAKEAVPLDIDMSEGQRLRVGTIICFESAFSQPARTLVHEGAQILFVLTNDEWFAGTTAPWEHAAMCAVRAAQNRIPVVQVANGGYSLTTDGVGRFLTVGKSDSSQVVTGVIPVLLKVPKD